MYRIKSRFHVVLAFVALCACSAECTNAHMKEVLDATPDLQAASPFPELAAGHYDEAVHAASTDLQRAQAHLWRGMFRNCIEPREQHKCAFPLRASERHVIVEDYSALSGITRVPHTYLVVAALFTGDASLLPPGSPISELAALSEPLRIALGLPEPLAPAEVLLLEDIAPEVNMDIVEPTPAFALGDFNEDGLLDVMWCRAYRGMLTVSLSDGSRFEPFEPLADVQAVPVSALHGGSKLVPADFNNDGHTDVMVFRGMFLRDSQLPNSLLRGNGDGTFEDITFESGLGGSVAASHAGLVMDWNLDGVLDLFVCNEHAPPELLLGGVDGVFTNATSQVLPGQEAALFCHLAVTVDVNDDGWPDVVASSSPRFATSLLIYLNNGPGAPATVYDGIPESLSFNRVQFFSGVAVDMDNDGVEEIVIGNHGGSSEAAGALLVLRKIGTVYDVAWQSSVPRLSGQRVMGLNVADLNNDGLMDIVGGYGGLGPDGFRIDDAYLNLGGMQFVSIQSHPNAKLGDIIPAHTVCAFDFDNDGDEDILKGVGGAEAGFTGRSSFHLNHASDILRKNKWLSVKLIGQRSNRGGIGAKVSVTVVRENEVEETMTRWAKQSSFGSNPMRLHIGLGEIESIRSVEVEWPIRGGSRDVFTAVEANQFVVLREGSSVVEYVAYGQLP